MPLDTSFEKESPGTRDSGLESLRIDRSRKRRRPPSRLKWVVSAVILLVAAVAAWMAYGRFNAPIEVETVRIRPAESGGQSPVPTVLSATGYIVAAHKIELAAKVSGRVAWIGVEKGDRVGQGLVLVRLEDEEFNARVVEAEGQLNSLKARLLALVNGSRPEEIARSEAELEQVRADLENARVSLERTRRLVEQEIMSKQTLDDAEARYNAQLARFNAFEKSYALMQAGPRREDIDSMRAQVRQAEGALSFARIQLENTVIRAPISGVILERNVERGEFVTTGFASDRGAKGYVVSMADLNDLQVELDINQNDFAKLGPRQPATLTTDAYPDRRYDGLIEEISPEANRQKATVQVKVKITNPDEYLRPEMNSTVAFQPVSQQTAKREPGSALFRVPTAALRDGAVFLLVDGQAVRRKVEVAGAESGNTLVSSGLIGGEDVIVSPVADLSDGQKVRPRGGNR